MLTGLFNQFLKDQPYLRSISKLTLKSSTQALDRIAHQVWLARFLFNTVQPGVS